MNSVVTFYRFTPLKDLDDLKILLEDQADRLSIKGTILLAGEGINGTLSGSEASLREFSDALDGMDGLADMTLKYSTANSGNPVFYRLKVRIKNEIVALGQPGVDPAARTGVHVDARAWNQLLEDPEVLVIDTRNDYETAIGTFPAARDPGTTTFKQFPDYVAGLDQKDVRVAMFCTGGIRCEKASAYMLSQGFDEVYQLDGGILGYLETVTPEENRWQGECFVFDQRVSVDKALGEGSYEQCFACRQPLEPLDIESEDYVEGVSCPHCIGDQDEDRRRSFEERQKQMQLAAARGDQHVGKTMGEQAQRTSKGSR